MQADADGRFDQEVTPGIWRCDANPYQYFPERDFVYADTCQSDVEVTLVKRVPVFNAAISGTVIDESGMPVVGVTVSLDNVGSAFPGPVADQSDTTLVDGTFGFSAYRDKWSVGIPAVWSEFAMQAEVTLADGQSTNLVLQLRDSPRAIRGTIRDTSNAPVASIQVVAETVTNGVSYSVTRTSDTNGAFELPSFAAKWRVTTYLWDETFIPPAPFNVHMGDTDITNDIVLARFELGATVRGEITDESGNLQTNAFISIHSFSPPYFSSYADTDHEGRFQFKVPPNDYQIYYAGQDVPLRVHSGTNEAKLIRRLPSATLKLTVHDTDGDALVGSSVWARMNHGGTNYDVNASVECGGLASLSLWPGTWVVSVQPLNLHSNYFVHAATKLITVGASNTSAAFTLRRSHRTTRVHASVVTELGQPVENAQIYWWGSDTIFLRPGLSALDEMSAPGAYFLSAWSGDPHWLAPAVDVNVVRQVEQTNFVLVFLQATNILRGRVHLPAGISPANGYLSASMNRFGTNYGVSSVYDPSGSYEMRLADGEWGIVANHPDCLCAPTNVTISSSITTLDFFCVSHSPGTNPSLRVHVIDEEGEPVPLVPVDVYNDLGWGWRRLTGTDGTFELPVFSGRINISAYPMLERGFISGTLRLKLEPGDYLTNATLVAYRPAAEITATVLDEFGTNVNGYLVAQHQTGDTFFYVSALGDVTPTLPLFPADWRIAPNDRLLNAQGLRSVPAQYSAALSNEHFLFFTQSIEGDGRVPWLSSPVVGTSNVQFKLQSQTEQYYRVERSADFLTWEGVSTNLSTGGSFSVTDTNTPNAFRFYRAVLMSPYY